MQYSYTTNGAADGSFNAYGNNEITVSGDVLSVLIGDSDGDKNINGVGIYELKLLNKNLKDAQKLAELLCSPDDPNSDVPISDLYGTTCDGKMRSGMMRNFSRPVAIKIADLVDSLKSAGVREGRKIVKLDLSLASINRAVDGFLVSLRFVNSGDYPITFKTPDKWETKVGKYMDILAVTDSSDGMSSRIGFALAGQPLANPAQFPDDEITVAPHSIVVVTIKTTHIQKFTAGTYDLNAGAFMEIKVVGLESSLIRVDFHSDYKNPTRVAFDRDYPSTPQEREQWEAYQRTRMSQWSVKPGQTFAEDGLYRAVRTSGSARGLLLKPFKAGDVATTEPVTMPMDSEYTMGTNIDGPVQWVWEASAPTPVKQWSFDLIDGTQQFCEPGVACPRSGRWVPRVSVGYSMLSQEYQYQLANMVTLRRGDTMPSIKGDFPKWEWVGVPRG
ncbi:hypothetical protein [Paraburkholderia sp. J63]|uniref:hypothetical protein n=1 Tax=Paraburkholderia sp. J63 TaxID=2805434 RepID=UPI002ABD5F14|nr:hypothetical protein [Paraburkholderia sp. J63]